MATARRRDQWDQWGFIAAWVAKVATGEDINPASLNPIRQNEVEKLQTPESRKQDAREFMAIFGAALGDKKAGERWLSADRAAEVEGQTQSAPVKPSSN